MTRHSVQLSCLLFMLVFIGFSGIAYAQNSGLAVMELFTSEGCPACPPADQMAKKIAETYADVLVLGCHVTYFDHDNWRDPMSHVFCDARQTAYRDSGTSRHIYTPQAVINGRVEAVGSHGDEVKNALMSGGTIMPVGLSRNGNYLDISLPGMNLKKPADVWLFSYESGLREQITSGSNAGKTVIYAHPVTDVVKLLSWDGHPSSMSYALQDDATNHAVIVQYADYTDIIAAGKTSH